MARPLSFEPQEKLHQAMLVFWKEGYENVSMNDLSEQLSINKFSIYKQFGNKNEFYLKALAHYQDTIFVKLLTHLEDRQGLSSIFRYFENLSDQLSKTSASYGCLINNTLLAGKLLPKECTLSARKMVGALRGLLKENFEVAITNGEIKQNPQDCVNFTLMNIQALLNTRKTLGPLVMQGNLKFLVRQISAW